MYLYLYLYIPEEFQFSMLTHYSLNAILKVLASCLCVWKWQFSIDSLDSETFPGWNDLSCAPVSFMPKRETFWIQLPIGKKKKVNGLCTLLPGSSFQCKPAHPCAPRWRSTGSHVTAILLFPGSALQQCVGEKRLSNKIFICFCNFFTPFNYEAPLVCWNKVNDSIIVVSA